MRAILIDDVPQARQTLRQDLGLYCPEVEIIGEAEGVVTAAKLLKKQNPDLLFLDIQMKDGSGFDLLDILPELPFKIIFTTASDAYAIQAFRYAAIDYLLKPIDPDELVEAVARAKDQLEGQQERLQMVRHQMQDSKLPERLALHTLEKIHITKISHIIRCESSGNYTLFYFLDGRKLLVTKTLKEFDKLLKAHQFLRVHQSHLINMRHIDTFVKTDGGYLIMKDRTKISVSVRKRPMVVKMLEDL